MSSMILKIYQTVIGLNANNHSVRRYKYDRSFVYGAVNSQRPLIFNVRLFQVCHQLYLYDAVNVFVRERGWVRNDEKFVCKAI